MQHPSLHSQIAQAIQDNITLDWDTDGYTIEADETASVIEGILNKASIDFAEWLRENEMRPEGGGWIGGKINVFDVGYKSRHLHKHYIAQLETTNQ